MATTHKPLSEDEIKDLAKHIVGELFSTMTKDENIAVAAKAWGAYLDRWIGKNVRRFLVFLFFVLSGMAAVKFEVWSRFVGK